MTTTAATTATACRRYRVWMATPGDPTHRITPVFAQALFSPAGGGTQTGNLPFVAGHRRLTHRPCRAHTATRAGINGPGSVTKRWLSGVNCPLCIGQSPPRNQSRLHKCLYVTSQTTIHSMTTSFQRQTVKKCPWGEMDCTNAAPMHILVFRPTAFLQGDQWG